LEQTVYFGKIGVWNKIYTELKILQLIDSLEIGGAERMCVNMANVFSNNRTENILICTRKKGMLASFLPKNTLLVELNKKSLFDLIGLFKLLNLVRKERPTLVHAHSTSIYWGCIIKLFFPRIKLLWHDHFGLAESLKNSDRRAIRSISRFIDGIVSVNEILLLWSKRNMNTKNVVFLKNFPYLPDLNISPQKDKNIILHLANLRPQKDHHTLIEAIRHLKSRISMPFEVWCAGKDFSDDYSKDLNSKISEYQLEDCIKFLGSVEDTNDILKKASIAILCSKSEGLPVSLLEYGLAGLPVVATNVGQCSEVLGNGKYGILVPPSNPILLAEGIERFMVEKDIALLMGMEFRKYVEQEYGAQKFMKEYLEFIYYL